MEKVSVIVVGAGPTGLTAANLLGSYGVETLVIERNPATADMPRAIVLDDEGARTFQSFGADDFLAQTIEGDGARYIDDEGKIFATVGAGPRTYGFAKRHFIFQPELERALLQNLKKFPSVKILFNAELEAFQSIDDRVIATYRTDNEKRTVEAPWMLACDGGRSTIRQNLNIDFGGSTYEQDWIVIDTVRDPDLANHSKFFCSAKRPSVSVPAPNGARRYEFMMLEGETRELMLSDTKLAELLSPHRPFRAEDIVRKTVYTFHARIASEFRRERILLLGDAAHVTPPFAGQGMNSGLRDAHNVAWKVAAEVKGLASHTLLDTYDIERRGPAWTMIQLAVAMGQIVMPKGAEQIQFRNLLLNALTPFPGVRDYFLQMRFKPKPRYDDGFFVSLHDQALEASLVGEMLPQPSVIPAAGQRTKLDNLLGNWFSLVVQDPSGEEAVFRLDHPIWRQLKAKVVRIAGKADPDNANFFAPASPEDAALLRPIRTHRDQVLLVRPDRYVCAAFEPGESDRIARSLAAMFMGAETSVRLKDHVA